jgi:uncharacterized protein involved in outer membrane biogenesis
MKKVLGIIILGGIALVILAVVAVFYLGPIVKAGVEKVGSQVAKVPVKLDGATISVFSGNGELKGFVLGNPEGFKSPEAVKVGTVAISLVPKSVTSSKVIVRSIRVEAPEITYEAGLGGSNIGKILENMQSTDKQEKSGAAKSSSKALQVDDFVITGGKIHATATVLGGMSGTLALPEIHLLNLGQGPEGVTAAELSSKVFAAITEAAAKTVAANAGNLGKIANDAIKGVGGSPQDQVKKLESGITDLLKSKKN